MDEFVTAFGDADSVFVLDIYPASEAPIEGVTGQVLAGRIKEIGGRDANFVGSFPEAARAAAVTAHEGDMILTLGAGSVSQLGPLVLEQLELKNQPADSAARSLVIAKYLQ